MVRNMTDFCKSFVYENDSATVSDLAELYNKGIFSYDIKIIPGGCYNGARHSDYPMPDKNKDANYRWKINTHKEAKKFSSYSEFKRRYGPAAYSYVNDDNCTTYVYMQKWINFDLRHFGSTGIESRIVKVRVDTDTILSVDEEYVMNV